MRPGRVRRDRAPAALGAHRGREPPLTWPATRSSRRPGRCGGTGPRRPCVASRRPATPLDLPHAVDVVVVGGGLHRAVDGVLPAARADPDLDVLVLEAEHVGFGASGRNGGWVLGAVAGRGRRRSPRGHGRAAALAQLRRAARHRRRGRAGSTTAEGLGVRVRARAARSSSPARRPRSRGRARRSRTRRPWGDGTVLARRRGGAASGSPAPASLGATFTPHCARVHPRRLVDGLARGGRAGGAPRSSRATRVARTADRVVVLEDGRPGHGRGTSSVATEGWTAALPGTSAGRGPGLLAHGRHRAAADEQWARIGLAAREVVRRPRPRRHLRPAHRRRPDRLRRTRRAVPLGLARSGPSSTTRSRGLRRTCARRSRDLLPAARRASRFTHAWGGPLGIARDWHPSVSWDPVTAPACAGGYVGDGVAATQPRRAARSPTSSLGRTSALTELPWVGHRSPRWEPEPLRWLGVNAGLRLAQLADREEAAHRPPRPPRRPPLPPHRPLTRTDIDNTVTVGRAPPYLP